MTVCFMFLFSFNVSLQNEAYIVINLLLLMWCQQVFKSYGVSCKPPHFRIISLEEEEANHCHITTKNIKDIYTIKN